VHLAWRDPALERVCGSSAALERRWPDSAEAVKCLLWLVKHSRDLAELARHPSVAVTASGVGGPGDPFRIRLRTAEMLAMALTRAGEVITAAGPNQLADHATALLVTDLTAEALGRLRKAI